MQYVSPNKCPDRNRIVFDDSGSMGMQVENAKKGVVEFLRNCIPNQTAVALHFMNTTSWNTQLRSDLPLLGQDILECELRSGGTPFFNTLKKALEATPVLTRLIAFTDGAPTDQLTPDTSEEIQDYWAQNNWMASTNVIVQLAKAIGGDKPIPIDTVYFGGQNQRNMDLLRYLSSETGGFFLHFDPAKVNFKTAFKYLTSGLRLQLTSGSFRAALERREKLMRPFILTSTSDDVPEILTFVDSIVCIINNAPCGCIVHMSSGVVNNFINTPMETMCKLVEDSMKMLDKGEKQ